MSNNTRAALLATIVTLAASVFAVVAAATSSTPSTSSTSGSEPPSDTTTASGSEPPSDTATTEPGGAQPSAGVDIAIDQFAFDPAEITIATGSAITWTNNEAVTHNVFTSDALLASPDLAEGDTYVVTFSEPAVVEYYCDIHQYMRGTVTVEP